MFIQLECSCDFAALNEGRNSDPCSTGEFSTVGDVPRAFRRALAKMGVAFYRGRTRTEYDGDLYEIVDRRTGEPLFVAIPKEV